MEQIDALKIMRIDPAEFLVVPRFVAAMVMIPALAIYSMALGLTGAVLVANLKSSIPPAVFLDSVKQTIVDSDFLVAIIKSFINTAIIVFFLAPLSLKHVVAQKK